MGTALDALNPAQQPLTARRPAASNLPVFELPPPTNFGLSKFPSPSSVNPISNVSNLLTPPSNHPGEGTTNSLPSGPGISTAISAAQEVPSYPSWQNQSSYPYGSPSQTSWGQASTGIFPPSRSVLSPSSGSLNRSSLPPTTGDSMAPHYDLNHHLPPFQQQSIPTSSPASATSVISHAQHPQQQAMGHLPSTSAPPSHQMGPVDIYGSRPLVNPLYNASPSIGAGPAGSYAPSYGGPSPVGQAGLGVHASRMQPGQSQSPPMQPPHIGYNRPPWPSYSLPAMSGPIMTNVHNPSGQMSLMGNMATNLMPGFTSGHLASMQQPMYGNHLSHHQVHGQSAPPNDRPFKCDQCPQSFNRNHDLKRHKRIHLSVKPFQCNHCEKSFSRKDALKRHLLVKGCGKNADTGSNSGTKDDESLTKVDSQSDKASPLSNSV